MGEQCFPDPQLKLVQKIDDEQTMDIKITTKFINKSILRMKRKGQINEYLKT